MDEQRNSTQNQPKKRYKTLTTNVKERQENLQSKQENLLSRQVRMEQLIEQLTREQQKQIKRMSTSRIWHQLFKAGYDKVDLESLSRQELTNKVAEDLLWESFTFWWKLCEQKQLQIRETHTVKLKQYLVKVGYNEEWIRYKTRIVVMEIMAEVMLAEEEQDEERRRHDEERRRQDEERRRREEKREQEEKEEKRRIEEEKRRLEEKEVKEKEYAARVLELRSQRKQRKYAEK